MTRKRLPNRRPSMHKTLNIVDATGAHHTVELGVGYDMTNGFVKEVFASGLKVGSAMETIVDDACVLVSIALQYGASPRDLAHSMSRAPVSFLSQETRPASVVGAIIEALVEETSR